MEKIEKSVAIVAKVLGIIVFIAAAAFLAASLLLTCANDSDEAKKYALLCLLVSYMFILFGIVLYKYCVEDEINCKFATINFCSFFLFCQFIPLIFVTGGLFVANTEKFQNYTHVIIIICAAIQCIVTYIWFKSKLGQNTERKDSELLKLDLYSTVAILFLTIIWVLYDIVSIKFAFALMLGTFMVLQVMIKRKSIILAENEENKIGK